MVVIEDIKGNTTITIIMGTKISPKTCKYHWGRCSNQQRSSGSEVGRHRGEKGMGTRGRSEWWRRTWSRAEQHQSVCQSQKGGQQGAGVHGGEGVRVQGGTRRRRRKRRRGSGDGARGQQRVGVGMDGWDGSGVFTHRVLRIHHGSHLHEGVDQS